jgi:hypothetical protein
MKALDSRLSENPIMSPKKRAVQQAEAFEDTAIKRDV